TRLIHAPQSSPAPRAPKQAASHPPPHSNQGTLRLFPIPPLLGLIPRAPARLLHQTQDSKIQPLTRPRMSPLANLQFALVNPAAPLRQIQPHRLAVRCTAGILPWVANAAPQHTGRRHTDD